MRVANHLPSGNRSLKGNERDDAENNDDGPSAERRKEALPCAELERFLIGHVVGLEPPQWDYANKATCPPVCQKRTVASLENAPARTIAINAPSALAEYV